MREIDALAEARARRNRLEDFRSGQIAFLLYCANSSKGAEKLTIEDFMPTVPKRPPQGQSYEELRALTNEINRKVWNQ